MYSHFNPLNSELNPICHLLALLVAHHILHVSRIKVKVALLEEAVLHCRCDVFFFPEKLRLQYRPKPR